MNDDEQPTSARPSKTEAKREAKRVEELAVFLIELPDAQRRRLSIEPTLIDSAQFAQGLTKSAARRERLRLAKALRADPDAVAALRAARDAAAAVDAAGRGAFRRVEALRDALVAGSRDIDSVSGLDAASRDTARTLLERYRQTHDERERKRCFRELFRLLREADLPDLGAST